MRTMAVSILLALSSSTGFAQALAPAPVPAAPAARLTIDTPLESLMADQRARAIVIADLGTDPSQHPMYSAFKQMSLAQIAPQSNGAVDDQKLKKIATDLATLK